MNLFFFFCEALLFDQKHTKATMVTSSMLWELLPYVLWSACDSNALIFSELYNNLMDVPHCHFAYR